MPALTITSHILRSRGAHDPANIFVCRLHTLRSETGLWWEGVVLPANRSTEMLGDEMSWDMSAILPIGSGEWPSGIRMSSEHPASKHSRHRDRSLRKQVEETRAWSALLECQLLLSEIETLGLDATQLSEAR